MKRNNFPLSGFGCIHEITVSDGLGASGLLVKHDNAIKLASNQTSPPSGGAAPLLLPKNGGQSEQYSYLICRLWGGPASAGWTHHTGPRRSHCFQTGSWICWSSLK